MIKNILAITTLGVMFSGCTSMLMSMVDMEGAYKEIFAELDKNADNIISKQEFHHMMSDEQEDREYAQEEAKKKGMSLARYEQAEWNKVDTNHDGKIDFAEFHVASDKQMKESE